MEVGVPNVAYGEEGRRNNIRCLRKSFQIRRVLAQSAELRATPQNSLSGGVDVAVQAHK